MFADAKNIYRTFLKVIQNSLLVVKRKNIFNDTPRI